MDIEWFKLECGLKATWAICGYEVCPTTQTPHLQCYIALKNATTLSALIKRWHSKSGSKRWHFTIANGTADQNLTYCSKEGNFFEIGTRPKGQGKRVDIDEVKVMVMAGKPLREIAPQTSGLQSLKFAETLCKYVEKQRAWKTEVYWLFGSTGTGKSETAHFLCPPETRWTNPKGDGRFWEGYDAHENIILDDYRRDFCKFHELLKIFDHYPYRIEVKGSSRELLAKRIFVTSPLDPGRIWEGRTGEDLAQLMRRIENVWFFDPSGFIEVRKGSKDPYELGIPNVNALKARTGLQYVNGSNPGINT